MSHGGREERAFIRRETPPFQQGKKKDASHGAIKLAATGDDAGLGLFLSLGGQSASFLQGEIIWQTNHYQLVDG